MIGRKYGEKAKRLLATDLEHVCLENIQACILIGNICFGEGEGIAESVYFGQSPGKTASQAHLIYMKELQYAWHMAHIMRLWEECPSTSAIARETSRRVWWSLYLADQWASAAIGLPRTLEDRYSPRLPMPEAEFQQLSKDAQDASSSRLGLWAHMVTLVRVWGPIQDLNNAVMTGSISQEDAETSLTKLSACLHEWVSALPVTDTYSMDNLTNHDDKGQGRTFLALHLGYHHYATTLYFQSLEPRWLSTPVQTIYLERCKYHARLTSEIIRISMHRPGCEMLYNIVGHNAVISSSILLHSLLFGKNDEPIAAKADLESNFCFLILLRRYYVSVDGMVRDFPFCQICV